MGKIAVQRKRIIHKPRTMIPAGRRQVKQKSIYPRRTVFLYKGKITLYKHRTVYKRIFRRFHSPLNVISPFFRFTKDIVRIYNTFIKSREQWSAKKRKPKVSTWSRKRSSWSSGARSSWSTSPERKKWDKFFNSRGFKGFIKNHEQAMNMKNIYQQPRGPDFDRIRRNWAKKELRGGPRDMSGRKYKYFGPYPKILGPNLVVDIIPTKTLLYAFKSGQKNNRTDYLKKRTKAALDDVREKLLEYATIIIEKYVPKETGDLQQSMLKSLLDSRVLGFRLKMNLKADVPYAGVTNRMPEKMLQHPKMVGGKEVRQRGRRSHKTLYDPKAQKGYFYLILMLLKNKAKKLIQNMVNGLVYTWAWRSGTHAYRHPPGKIVNIKHVETIPGWVRVSQKEHLKAKYLHGYIPNLDIQKPATMIYYEKKIIPDTLEDRKDMREVRMRELQTRMWKEAKPVQVNYPKNLIKGFFKIKGLYRR